MESNESSADTVGSLPAEIPLACGVTFDDGKHLIVGGALILFTAGTSQPRKASRIPLFQGSCAPAVSPRRKWLVASAPDDPSVRLWNIETATVAAAGARGIDYICFAFSPDGRVLASGLRNGEIILWTRPASASQ
jgi:WD40 repeat protein